MSAARHAVILAGGLGTRLHGITGDRLPKALADIAGRPFLDYLLHDLANSGAVRAFTFCIGHHGAMIRARYGTMYGDIPVYYAEEHTPLGTGGALAAALRRLSPNAEPVIVCNGDCMAACDISRLSAALDDNSTAALALAHVPDASRFGAVSYDDNHVITGFAASGAAGPAYINAGRYLIRPDKLLAACPKTASFSLEHDVFMPAAGARILRAMPYEGAFLDIGIPDDYAIAQTWLPETFPIF